jgi:hypothetical protein
MPRRLASFWTRSPERPSVRRVKPRIHSLVALVTALTACASQGKTVPTKIVTASEFRLTGDDDRTRASLAMEKGAPVLALFDDAGRAKLRAALDPAGLPSVSLYAGGDATKASAVVEVDDKGAHVLFRGAAKQETYVFQKTDGTAGIVLAGADGAHRGEMKLGANGEVDITLFDAAGKSSFAVTVSSSGAVERKDVPPR